MLTDTELKDIADKIAYHYTGCSNEHCPECIGLIREAVRLCAERCAEICDNTEWSDACAAAIRERIKDKPRPPFDPNQGFGPI